MRNNFTGTLRKEFQFFAQPSDDWDGRVFCSLVEFQPPAKIAFTWDANNIGGETLVTIELTAQDDSTRIKLVHANFENASRDVRPIVERHVAGWEDHLRVLAIQLAEEIRGEQVAPGTNDWTSFDLYVAIDAEPSTIMSAWSTIKGMESFFVQMMQITRPDGAGLEHDAEAQPGEILAVLERSKFESTTRNPNRMNGPEILGLPAHSTLIPIITRRNVPEFH